MSSNQKSEMFRRWYVKQPIPERGSAYVGISVEGKSVMKVQNEIFTGNTHEPKHHRHLASEIQAHLLPCLL